MAKNNKKEKKDNYRNISLRTPIFQQIETFVKNSGLYNSVTEFVREAARLRLQELTKKAED